MATVASSHSNDASPSHSHRKPNKKPSLLSLRRERTAQYTEPSPSMYTNTAPPLASPHSDTTHRSTTARPTEFRERTRGRNPPKHVGSVQDDSEPKRTRGKDRQHTGEPLQPTEQSSYAFPGILDEKYSRYRSSDDDKVRSRSHSHTAPSRKPRSGHGFYERTNDYPLRNSASSTLSHSEDAPHTPIDDLSFRDPIFSLPVVVAAPTPGVETMDALVDGMDHYGNDDHFMNMGGLSSRGKVSKSGYHPLYHPPLPKPPPGVKLGGAIPRQTFKASDSDEEEAPRKASSSSSQRSRRQKAHRLSPSRSVSDITVTDFVSTSHASPSYEDRRSQSPSSTTPKTIAPSISDIIRAHAPPAQQLRSRKTSYATTHTSNSHGHSQKNYQPDVESAVAESDTDLVSRSSVDTIANEVQQTIRVQKRASVNLQSPKSLNRPPYSPPSAPPMTRRLSSRSESRRESSIYSYSTTISDQPPLPASDFAGLTKIPTSSPSQTIAQYLRSARLTTILKLTRAPHASRGNPLTVSLSDLGSPTGFPLVVFLGLGCVRHIMGLYDEMAECLGIRLITIDRWGLGRTDTPRSKSAKGIPEWANVVEEVLDQLHIDQCSIMAHSAGAPYALAFANKHPERVRGDICLLAPWVGGGEGSSYKWLKYVPNGILKTAQAAEWKVQAWMLGKPPTMAFEGIGYDLKASSVNSPSSPTTRRPTTSTTSRRTPPASMSTIDRPAHLVAAPDPVPRPSVSSGTFSEYDDLRDFDGRFESKSTLGRSSGSARSRTLSDSKPVPEGHTTMRKTSRGFLGRLKSSNNTPTHSPPGDATPIKRLKALRSMGSLKGRSSRPSTASKTSTQTNHLPWMPAQGTSEIGLGLTDDDWMDTIRNKSMSSPPQASLDISADSNIFVSPRANGRRSMSFSAANSPSPPVSFVGSSPRSTPHSSPASFQAALGNALIAASHSESAKGTHGDLLQILNHDRQPWGFSYAAYPHTVRVWYGDKDERIAENAVRWMETTMGHDKCLVQVVKGADHSLMFRSGLVVDVLEQICEYWRDCE